MKIDIQAMSLDLTEQELRSSMSPEALAKLKGKTVHPWIVGETGTSRPRELESGKNRVLKWGKRAIQALRTAIKAGTKLFVSHGAGTNSHDGREQVGEVVETFERELPDGRFQAIAVGLLDDDRPDLDVCSVEANIDFTDDGGPSEVTDVMDVSAVALGSSRVDSPAFPGAQRLASFQFFGENEGKEGAKVATPTLAEVMAFLKEHEYPPSKFYTPDDIREDKRFSKIIEDSRDAEERAKKAETERDEALKTAEDAKTANAENAGKVVKVEGKEALKAAFAEGMTEPQKAFLLKGFDPTGPEDITEESLKSYIESGNKEFAEYAKMFAESSTPSGGKESGAPAGGDAGDELLKSIIG